MQSCVLSEHNWYPQHFFQATTLQHLSPLWWHLPFQTREDQWPSENVQHDGPALACDYSGKVTLS